MPAPKNPREFKLGDKIRVNLHHAKIEDAVVRVVIQLGSTTKLQIDFGNEQTALTDSSEVRE